MKRTLFILSFTAFTLAASGQMRHFHSNGATAAVVVDEVPLAHTAQLLPLNEKGRLVGAGNIRLQTEQVLKNLALSLKEVQAGMEDVVKLNVCLHHPGLLPEVQGALQKRFGSKQPAVSYVTGNLPAAGALLGIDAIAAATRRKGATVTYHHSRQTRFPTTGAGVAVLPAGGAVYISGQADKGPLGPATMGTLRQLDTTLHHLKLTKENIVQVRAFINPMADIRTADSAFTAFFAGASMPPVVYVEWVSKDPLVEIELIAASPAGGTEQLEFITPPGMTASPVYAKVTRLNRGKKIYCSSLYGTDTTNAAAEVNSLFMSLKNIVQTAGGNMEHLVKALYYVSDNGTSTSLNEIRRSYYNPQRPPAASKAAVSQLALPGHGITIDMIGVVTQ